MLWFALVGCSEAGRGEVAAVMLAHGDAHVLRDGQRLPARSGDLLGRDDVLSTGAGSALFVHLHNDHVVRIDAELELPVRELVMLAAPASTVQPGDQLAGLVDPRERAQFGDGLQAAERVAGWHARVTAAWAPTGAAPSEREIEGGPPPAEPPARSPRSPKSGFSLAPEAPPPPAAVAPEPAVSPPPPPPAPAPAPGGPPLPTLPPTTLPELQLRFAEGGELRACVVGWAAALPVPVPAITVRLVVTGGVVQRTVVEEGGLALPACAVDALIGLPLDASEARPRLRIGL